MTSPIAKPSLRTIELARIHAERQSAIIATVLQELPDPIPKHCLKLLRHAPESFDDLRYGSVAAAAFNLHLNHRPISILTVQEELARAPARADLSEVFNFLKLRPMPLSAGILEWECEELWHAYAYRQQATVLYEGSQALIASPAQADSIIAHVRRAIDDLSSYQQNGDGLPEIISSRKLLEMKLPLPATIIDCLLHLESKMSLGGGSKAFKSWTFLDLAFSVSTGTPWLGFPTTRTKVLIVNFEIGKKWMAHRIEIMRNASGLDPEEGYLDIWNLRGKSAAHEAVIPKIIQRTKDLGYGLIIIDPSYKLIGQGDENSASDVGAMMASFEQITVETGAAVLFGAHFAKGNPAAKDSIDRVSGSGVFARDPDTILTFTPHESPNCFTFEATLRNLAPISPFVVEWHFPRFERQPDLNPDHLKKRPGRPKSSSTDDILHLLSDAPLTSNNWQKLAFSELGVSRSLFYQLKDQLSRNASVIKSKINDCWTIVSKS